ncbi:hypothetical protein [Microbacterium sp. BH-3-3-3]|uniref:hypothetical protein n=1 Tax=Microbacterium sp. BH-3-3-3 TaxID=1906742 RepID=UPI0016433559|nr:hypothetical protein [Microbacterium sp. BH-3-3-3]
MTRIRLHAPSFEREVDVDLDASSGAREDLIEAEGMTWVRDGDSGGMPRYVPASSG